MKCFMKDHRHDDIGLAICEGICIRLRSVARVGALRSMAGSTASPNWPDVGGHRYELLMSSMRVWMVCDDDGSRIGWASFDQEDRVYVDGESEGIASVKVASHSDDRPNAFVRGFLVLFLMELKAIPGFWLRFGMGQIFQGEWFKDVSVSSSPP